MSDRKLVGVDGCPGGWIAVFLTSGAGADPKPDFRKATQTLFQSVAEVVDFAGPGGVIAIDMPIGLPDRIEGPGRIAEQTVRPLLANRRSSIFSVPSRNAVYANDYEAACRLARQTSNPPKALSKQAFNILPKIREVDQFLRAHPQARSRVFECHPELAFATLNGGLPMSHAKKARADSVPIGMEERRKHLRSAGFSARFLDARPQNSEDIKPAPDDFIDACACLWVAGRIAGNIAKPHPSPPQKDRFGVEIAIWA